MSGRVRFIQLLLLFLFIFVAAIAESAIRIRVRDPYMVPKDEEDKAVQGVALQILKCGVESKSGVAKAADSELSKIKKCTMEWMASTLPRDEHDQLILWLASDAEIDGPGVCGPYEIKRAQNRMMDPTTYERVLCLFRVNRDLPDKRTLSFFYFKRTLKGWRLSALR